MCTLLLPNATSLSSPCRLLGPTTKKVGPLCMWMWQIDLFTWTTFYRINEWRSKGLVLILLGPWDFLYSGLEEMLRGGEEGGDHLWASRLLLRHLAGSCLACWTSGPHIRSLQKYICHPQKEQTWWRIWLALRRWSRWLGLVFRSSEESGRGWKKWRKKSWWRALSEGEVDKKHCSQTLWSQTILATSGHSVSRTGQWVNEILERGGLCW